MESKIIIAGLVAIAFVGGSIMTGIIAFGDDDEPGGSGTLTVIDRESETISIERGSFGSVAVFCEPGEIATGGGFHTTGDGFPFIVINAPEPPNGWEVGIGNNEPCPECGDTITVEAIVMCATLDGGVGGNGDDDDDDDD